MKKAPFHLRYWLNLSGFTVLLLGAVYYLALPVWLAWGNTRPLRHAVLPARQFEALLASPGAMALDRSLAPITVTAADGITLQGWFLPPRNGAVILLFPGYGGDRSGGLPYARFLAQAGFGLLMMDPRATGESEGRVRAYGWMDWGDGPALVAALLQRPDVNPNRLGAFGCSTGAEIALGAAAFEPRIAAVVADAPYYADFPDISMPVTAHDWLALPLYPPFLTGLKLFSGARPPMTLVEAVAEVAPRPLLLIAGGQSDGGYEARQAAHFYARAGAGAELWVIPQAEHCGGVLAEPEAYPRRVITFFETTLLRER